MVSGSGIKNKVLEALAMEKVVLATPEAWEGIDDFEGRKRLSKDWNFERMDRYHDLFVNQFELDATKRAVGIPYDCVSARIVGFARIVSMFRFGTSTFVLVRM